MKSSVASLILSTACFWMILLFVISNHPSQIPVKERETPGESDALRAFDWWYDQRAMPDEVIPHGAYSRAAEYLKSGKLKRSKERVADGSSFDQWKSIGPNNVGGRTLAIAVNPSNTNIVWAGSASGGLWKSTNGGTGSPAWEFVNTGFPLISVSAIAIDSTNPNIMYVGSGEISLYKRPLVGTSGARASYGLGILKSTNAGATWDSTGLIFGFPEITAVQKIAINPQNVNTVYAATSEGTFKTTNAGVTWFLVHDVLMAMDIVINPVDTAIIYASYGNLNSTSGAGVYMSLDAGDSWTHAMNGLPLVNFGRTPLTISRINPSILYAGVSDASSGYAFGVYRTSDGGANWVQVNDISYTAAQGWYDNVVAVDPGNPNLLYISGFDVYRSFDGGAIFDDISSTQAHVDHHVITFEPGNPLTMYFGCDGGIYKSTDGGTNFINLNNGYVTTQFYPGLSVSPLDSNLTMGGLQDNSTVITYGSLNWTTVIGADGGWTAMNSQNKDIMYGEYQYLALFRSLNGGASFSNINVGLPSGQGRANFIPPYAISYSSPNVLYAGTKTIYKSINGGSGWFPSIGIDTALNGTFVSAVTASWTSPETVMAATGQGNLGPAPSFKVYASTNGGGAWRDVTGSLPYRYPTDIEFDPADSRIAYVTFSGYGSGHVFKTTDVGTSWTNITANLPDIPHQAVTVDPEYPSHLYVGTDLGVFYSSDGGSAWEEFATGMPPAMVLDVVFSRANNSLRAATFGNGVYERRIVRVPTISLSRPAGGESWIGGTVENIKWSSRFVNAVKIQYSLNNGSSWGTVNDSVPAASLVYPWLVPSIETSQGLIRITEVGNPSFRDTSTGYFSVVTNPDVVTGWNMVSLDRTVTDGRKIILFPNATTNAFAYQGNYVVKDTLQPGAGYWLKYAIPQHTPYAGDSITTDTIDVRAGWNMVGALSVGINVSSIIQIPSSIITTNYFGYSNGYSTASMLSPRKGYWVKTNAPGKLVLTSTAMPPLVSQAQDEEHLPYNSITIRDEAGNTQTLYFTSGSIQGDASKWELPPPPPAGVFDARFSSQRFLEASGAQAAEFPISIRDAVYPVEMSWEVNEHRSAFVLLAGKEREIQLAGKNNLTLRESDASNLRIKSAPAHIPEVPSSFGLDQNYPNPFNPKTSIEYRVANKEFISLKIYDVSGREVATLVNEEQAPGSYSVSWDVSYSGGGIASGIYFYRLKTSSYQAVKKMVLIK